MWKIGKKSCTTKELKLLFTQCIPARIKLFFFVDLIFMVKSQRKNILFTDSIFNYPVIDITQVDLQTIIANKYFCIIQSKNGLLVVERQSLKRLYIVKSKTIKSITFYESFQLLCMSTYGTIFLVDLRTGKYHKILHDDCHERPQNVEVLHPSLVVAYQNKLRIYTNGKQEHCFHGAIGEILRRNTDKSFWAGGEGLLSFYRFNKKSFSIHRFPLPRSENLVDILPLTTICCVSMSEMGTIRIWNNIQKECLYTLTIPVYEPYSFRLNMYKNDIVFQYHNKIYVIQNPIVEQDYRNFQLLQECKPDSIFNMYGMDKLLQSYLFLV